MSNFLPTFIRTYTEIDQQYRRVLNARKSLFVYDTLPPAASYFSIDASEISGEICWDKEEAEVAAAFYPVDLPAKTPYCACHFMVTFSPKTVPTYESAMKAVKRAWE